MSVSCKALSSGLFEGSTRHSVRRQPVSDQFRSDHEDHELGSDEHGVSLVRLLLN